MTRKETAALLLLSSLWGGSFLFMRVASPVLGPILLIALRVGIAGLALLAYMAAVRTLPRLDGDWRQYLVIGGLNSALPFVLIATASLHLPASLTATLNATTPLFGAVIAALWLGEPLTVRKLAGLLLGLIGVAALVGLGPVPLTRTTLTAVSASLLAALSYGFAAVYTRVRMPAGKPRTLTLYSQLCATLLLLPLVPFSIPDQPPSGVVIASVLALALLSTAFAYLLYFYLILSAGPTRATMVTYLAPAFGILWGALLLKEQLSPGHFIGFALILSSVVLVSRTPRSAAPVPMPPTPAPPR